MKVIIINGIARAGKDTFADLVASYAAEKGKAIFKTSTVDDIKKISKMCFGVGDEKTDKERRLWSDLKDAWTRYNDGPFNGIAEHIKNNLDADGFFVMCREPEEIAKFKKEFGDDCITIIVDRDDLETPDNHADQNVSNYQYMYYVENNGTIDDLVGSAEIMYEEIFGTPAKIEE